MILRSVIFILVCWSLEAVCYAQMPKAAPNIKTIAQLEQEQDELLQQLKAKLAKAPVGPQREKLANLLAEIEERIAEQKVHITAFVATKDMTPAMADYWHRASRRIEDCGTRHFPTHGGKKLYGKGTLLIRIARDGDLVRTVISTSSGNHWLDASMQRIVAASAPFGPLPEQVRVDQMAVPGQVVVASDFKFSKDDSSPPDEFPESERCKFPR